MNSATVPYGVYVHVPFCRMLCTYCDFVKYRGMEAWYDRYVDAVVQEATTWQGRLTDRPGVSLFLGGGTPTVLGAARLAALLAEVRAVFALGSDVEYCLEANPEDVNAALAGGIAAAGFNRVSVGIQTFDDALLRRLGRLHSAAQATAAVRLLAAAGVPSVSVDLMFGLPGQSITAWQETLDHVIDLAVPHISCYGLTVEPATPLGRQVGKKRLVLPDDDAAADMYEHACARLGQAGYGHYEVSNWAFPGHESHHNRVYWRGQDYVGLGAGAVGCVAGRRWWNVRQVEGYCAAIDAGDTSAREEEILTPTERARELLLLALRTAAGLNLGQFEQEVGWSLPHRAGDALREALDIGLVQVDGGQLRVPERHWGVLNSVVARLLATVCL